MIIVAAMILIGFMYGIIADIREDRFEQELKEAKRQLELERDRRLVESLRSRKHSGKGRP